MLIYAHGFNSSQASTKAQQLLQYFTEAGEPDAVVCPTLPYRPKEAMDMLDGMIQSAMQSSASVKLAGSSLGGFYATWLAHRFDIKAIAINPAVHAQHLLADAVGEQKNYSSGEIYQFTRQHLDELAEFDLPRITKPENILLMVETGDEVLDYTQAVDYYAGCRQIVVEGGDHGFRSFMQHIPTILAF